MNCRFTPRPLGCSTLLGANSCLIGVSAHERGLCVALAAAGADVLARTAGPAPVAMEAMESPLAAGIGEWMRSPQKGQAIQPAIKAPLHFEQTTPPAAARPLLVFRRFRAPAPFVAVAANSVAGAVQPRWSSKSSQLSAALALRLPRLMRSLRLLSRQLAGAPSMPLICAGANKDEAPKTKRRPMMTAFAGLST